MRYTKLHQNQSGLVSIIVTMLVMMILGITVIGFAQVSRREQRQTLDRQLSTAAYYAAESGINDAIQKIENNTITGNFEDCDDSDSAHLNKNIGSGGNFAYTCLLVDQNPDKLEYGSIDPEKSQIIPINSNGESITRIEISWQDKSGSAPVGLPNAVAPFPAGGTVPGAWNLPVGMLEVSLTPESNYERNAMIDNTVTGYLYPSSNLDPRSNTLRYDPAPAPINISKGEIVSGKCITSNTPRHCKAIIDLTGAPSGSTKYLMRLRAIYKSSAVTITAYNGTNQLSLTGAQAVIDSTGKANDVLRRVQVRVPRHTSYNYPEYVLDSSDSICKQLSVYPGGGSTSADCPL